jgi:hypothetical protein
MLQYTGLLPSLFCAAAVMQTSSNRNNIDFLIIEIDWLFACKFMQSFSIHKKSRLSSRMGGVLQIDISTK